MAVVGGREVPQEGDHVQIDRTRQAKQAQPADPNMIASSRAAAGTEYPEYVSLLDAA